MSSKKRICLSNLYQDEDVRNTVWTILTEDFEDAFERLLKEAKDLQSSLVQGFYLNKNKIKELYIEYGYKMVTLTDLKKALDHIPRYEENWSQNE